MAAPNPDLLAVLARQLAAEEDVAAVLRVVVDAALSHVDGAEHAGITALSRKSPSTLVATDDIVQRIDQHQYDTQQGPCLTAAMDHEPVVRVDDLRTDSRWPEFAAAVLELGVRSILSFHLYSHRDTLGALNIYAGPPNAFNDDSVHTGTLLAAHAAVAAAATTKVHNLRVALGTRDVIGQAKGILMERYKIDANAAFDLLIGASQHTHRKLNEVASRLATTGELRLD